jgi:putative NADH-flavin reductase
VRRILILGATGGTGRHLLSKALDAGLDVTVFVRDPSRLPSAARQPRIVTGNVTDEGPALAEAVRGQEAVISALGRGQSFKSEGLFARGMPLIVRTMEKEGVRRLIHTSAFGVGSTRADLPLLPRFFTGTLLREIYVDKARGDEAVRQSQLDWTIVYPSGLTNKPATGRYRIAEHLPLRGLPTIPRADVADFLLRQLDDSTYIRKGVMISA